MQIQTLFVITNVISIEDVANVLIRPDMVYSHFYTYTHSTTYSCNKLKLMSPFILFTDLY